MKFSLVIWSKAFKVLKFLYSFTHTNFVFKEIYNRVNIFILRLQFCIFSNIWTGAGLF